MSWSVRCLVPAVVLMAGCGEKPVEAPKRAETHPVSGKLTIRGKPLVNADIVFHSADGLSTARGRSDGAGLYFLTTYVEKDGAAAGLYKVTVTQNPNAPPPGKGGDEVIPPIPPEGESFKGAPPPKKSEVPVVYGNPASTTLSAEVKAGPNTISLDLK